MIPKYKQRSYILDKMQRGVVNICMAVTVIATSILMYRGYHYYVHIRPALKEMQLKTNEELLEEGKYAAAS